MDQDLISVVMPVYNSEKFLSHAIKSVLGQTYKNFEFIIVDDCSSDNSLKIIKEFTKTDPRVKLFKNDVNSGVGFTLNQAINKSQGKYIARMDSDDMMVPTRLDKQIKYLKKNKKIICVGSWMKEVNEKNQVIDYRITPLNHNQIYEKMFYEMAIQNPTLMINKGLVPNRFTWSKTEGILDDLDLLFKLLQFGDFGNIDEYLMLYRIHGNNLSLKDIKITFNEALYIRNNSIKTYSYKPTIKAKIISLFQNIIVNSLPNQSLYFLYKIFRKLNI